MSQKQDKFPTERVSMSDTIDLLVILANIALALVCPIVRSRTGKRYPGVYALLAGFVILFLAGEHRDRVVLVYFYAWFALLVIRRIQTFVYAKGTHTQFHGYPLFYRWLGGAAFLFEPVWAFILGAALKPHSPGLGLIWLSAAAGMLYLEVVERLLRQRRIEAMTDAGIEAEQRAAMARPQ